LEHQRYSAVAIALHWAIALLILGQVAGGLYMHNLPNSAPVKFDLYQLHKSFGLSILLLTIVRLGWRFGHKPPALPAAMPGWQKIIARITHWAFYALLFATPLAGWAMVSVSPLDVPTVWFGLIEAPHLPFFGGVADRGGAEDLFQEGHEYLALSIVGLLVLHVGAALKHGFLNQDGVLRSMAPGAGALIGVVAIFAILGAGAFSYTQSGAPQGETSHDFEHEHDHEAKSETDSADAPLSAADDADMAEADGDIDAVAEAETQAEEVPVAATDAHAPPAWAVNYETSALRFIGEEGGAKFEGVFSDFTADIVFDPDNLGASSINVDVRTASASSGNEFRDGTMPDGEWFDVKDHPGAIFTSNTIRNVSGESYEADGVLTIKEISRDITLAFTLDIDGDQANAAGGVDLVRTDFGLGMNASWLEKEKVALSVRVAFEINAVRAD